MALVTHSGGLHRHSVPPAGYHHLPSQPSAIGDGRTDGPEDIQGGGRGGEADEELPLRGTTALGVCSCAANPLQWDWSPAQDDDAKDGLSPAHAEAAAGNRAGAADGDECCGSSRRWKRQVVAAETEWGEDKLLLLRRAKKRLALYLIGCHHHGHGRRALPFRSAGGSCTVAMLSSR